MLNLATARRFVADDPELDPPPATEHRISRPIDILAYVTAGNATFTLQGSETRFTYRVRRSEDKAVYFVAVLTGPNNTADYSFAGIIPNSPGAEYRHGKRSKIGADARSVRAFAWYWHALRLKDEDALDKVTFFHLSRCGRCGRPLTVPESIERGIGPDCAGLIGKE